MLESELRLEVLNAFFSLTQAISNLCDAIIQDSDLIAWVQDHVLFPADARVSARQKACAILNQLQYTDDQAPREIVVCAGFVGASSHTLNLAILLNECKDRFKKSILALKAVKISPSSVLTEKIHSDLSRSFSTATTLRSAGLSRLHLKQCYRKIPILNDKPCKISWTWAHTRAINKITVVQAREMLNKKGDDPGIKIQLQKLNFMSPEDHLAIVQELAPHLRANVVFSKDNVVQRTMIKGPIPILFPCEPEMSYPQFNPPSKKCERNQNRLRRSDVRLDPIPFLPAIRAHRYL